MKMSSLNLLLPAENPQALAQYLQEVLGFEWELGKSLPPFPISYYLYAPDVNTGVWVFSSANNPVHHPVIELCFSLQHHEAGTWMEQMVQKHHFFQYKHPHLKLPAPQVLQQETQQLELQDPSDRIWILRPSESPKDKPCHY